MSEYEIRDREPPKMSVRGAAIWAMAGQYVSFALMFVTSVVLSRFFLKPAEVGLFSIALASAMMVSILQDFGITRYLSGHPALTAKELRTCAGISLLLSLVIGGIILALAYPLSLFYGEPRLLAILVMIAASYLFVPWSVVPNALLSRDLDFRGLFMVNTLSALANTVTSILLAWQGFAAEALAIAMIVQAAVRALVGQSLRPVPVPLIPRLRGAGPVLHFGTASTVLGISGSLGVRSPDLIVGRILGLSVVGLYSRSSALAAQLHMLVVGAIGSVFYPAFARLRDEGRPLGPHYERVVAGYGAVVWPAMALLATLAQPVILVLYGPVWRDAGELLVWMALGEICFVMLPLHIDLPILLGQINRVIRYNLFDTAAAMGTLIVFCQWGLHYAAMSRLVYGFLWIGVYARMMHGLIGFSWKNMITIYLRSAALSLATAAPALLAYAFWRSPENIGFEGLVGLSMAGVTSWLASLLLLRHPARSEIMGMIQHALWVLPIPRLRRLLRMPA